jgi:hypothetical protein
MVKAAKNRGFGAAKHGGHVLAGDPFQLEQDKHGAFGIGQLLQGFGNAPSSQAFLQRLSRFLGELVGPPGSEPTTYPAATSRCPRVTDANAVKPGTKIRIPTELGQVAKDIEEDILTTVFELLRSNAEPTQDSDGCAVIATMQSAPGRFLTGDTAGDQ